MNAAHYEKKAAFTNYLPKIEFAGGYMRTQKEISLLSDEQKQTIGNLGTAAGSQLQQGLQALAAQNPGLAAGLQGLLPGAVAGVTNGLNAVGEGIVNALRTDTNIGDTWKDKLIALLSSSELRKLFKYNILKDKQEGASRVFIAIDEKLYAFYNIRLGNKLVKQLFPDKIFLNKDDYHDPLKNIEELLFSL